MHKCEIAGLKLDSPFLLAPLAGITDSPFRRICRRMGAALTYTEMISAKGLTYGDRNTKRLLHTYEDEGIVVFSCLEVNLRYSQGPLRSILRMHRL